MNEKNPNNCTGWCDTQAQQIHELHAMVCDLPKHTVMGTGQLVIDSADYTRLRELAAQYAEGRSE